MKLSHETAEELVRRWKILEKYPTLDKGEEALVEALQDAWNVVEAERFVTNWIKEHRKCAMPCDIHNYFGKPQRAMRKMVVTYAPIPKGQDVPPPEYYCDQCEDTGWYIVNLRERTWDSNVPYTGAKRCTHPADRRGKKAV